MMEQIDYPAIGREVIAKNPTVVALVDCPTVREVLEAALSCEDRSIPTGIGFCVMYALALGDDRLAYNPHLARVGRYLTAVVDAVGEVDSATVNRLMRARSSTGADPSPYEQYARLRVVQIVFMTLRRLGLVTVDPTLEVPVPLLTPGPYRILTDGDVSLGRVFSQPDQSCMRDPLAWKLGEAGGFGSDLDQIAVRHAEPETGLVWTPGGPRTKARLLQLDRSGTGILRAHLRDLGPDVEPDSPLLQKAGRTTVKVNGSGLLRSSLVRTGLSRERAVKPSSVAGWSGRQVYDLTGDLTAAARHLGFESLDQTARWIGLDWDSSDLS